MASLHLDVSGAPSSSPYGLIIVCSLIVLGMIGTVGYLAWKNRKDTKDPK